MRKRLESYINRAEFIKKHVEREKESEKYHEKIEIEENATGYSYKTVIGRFLDGDVTKVEIDDPYIRSVHQVGASACPDDWTRLTRCLLGVQPFEAVRADRSTVSQHPSCQLADRQRRTAAAARRDENVPRAGRQFEKVQHCAGYRIFVDAAR